MSNYAAIATVTATLKWLLQSAIGDIGGARARADRPGNLAANTSFKGVNIYLYQLTHNAASRNTDLPTRRPDGSLALRPQAALDLHYLLSFYGNDDELEPQLMLGRVVCALHSQPVLTHQFIQNALREIYFTNSALSNLAESLELVRITPLSLSLEELSKLWSIYFQTPYTLSVAYQAGVLLLESDDQPQQTQPVLQPRLYVTPFHQPIIDTVTPQMVDAIPGTRLTLQGQNFRSDQTLVRMGNSLVTPELPVTNQRLLVAVPPHLQAGIQSVQVIQPVYLGTLPILHERVEFESNVAAFVLRPTINELQIIASPSQITLQVSPTIGKDQRVVVLLNALSRDLSTTYTVLAPLRSSDSNIIMIPLHDVPPGDYLVRIRVDDAESVLHTIDGVYTGPKVTI